MQTNERVIEKLAERKMLKALAMFHLLKKKVSHGVIYDYNATKVAKLTGLSEKTVRKYIRALLELNIAESTRFQPKSVTSIKTLCVIEFKDGHLYLNKIKPKRHFCTIKFKKTDKLSKVESLLYGKLIAKTISQQVYSIHTKQKDKRIIGDDTNLVDRQTKNTPTVKSASYDVRTSVDLLCGKLSISKRKLYSVVGVLKESGIVMVKPRIACVRHCSFNHFLINRENFIAKHGYCWWHKGKVWNNQTNYYHFLDYGGSRVRVAANQLGIGTNLPNKQESCQN